jgi:hypothetical protein
MTLLGDPTADCYLGAWDVLIRRTAATELVTIGMFASLSFSFKQLDVDDETYFFSSASEPL